MSRGADRIVEQLLREGIDTVFALPGIQIMSLFDALYRQRDSIRTICARHEQALSYMAYGYALTSNRPGVVVTVPGPGVLNASAGLATAYAANVPMLLLTGQVPRAMIDQGRGQLHEIVGQLDTMRPITDGQWSVMEADSLARVVATAFTRLSEGRRRPVVLEVPPEALSEPAASPCVEPVRTERVRATDDVIEKVAQLLKSARQPALFVGGGALRAEAETEIQRLAELVDAPVITTQNAKGIVPETSDRALGVTYFAGLGPMYQLAPECDVIVCIGTRLYIRNLEFRDGQHVVHVNVDASELGKVPNVVPVHADAREFSRALIARLEGFEPGPRPVDNARAKQRFTDEIRSLAPQAVGIIDELRAQLADDDIVVSGMNSIGYWSHVAYPVTRPRTYVTPGYFGTLGYAFSTALGAKAAHPERRVIALCGDGGFLFSDSELATARAHDLDVLAIVFNNDAFGASLWDQAVLFEEREIGTRLVNPDFMKLADAFGIRGLRCTMEDFGDGLSRALAIDKGTVLLEVRVPNMMPPFRRIPYPKE